MAQAVVPLMVATTAVTAYGTYQAGKAQEKQAQYNSQIIERDAEIKENFEMLRERRRLAKMIDDEASPVES